MTITAILKNKEYVFTETKDLTVRKVFKKLDILPETHLCVREGELITEQELLREGDVIRLIAVISGG
ncbi:MAG: MoaD/ThiS family protein [Anaerolineaceae bacterium]|jgi:sulfur carrier protein|nr:MoaD/ThiS family protein [Anaerolineaceae bacterium]